MARRKKPVENETDPLGLEDDSTGPLSESDVIPEDPELLLRKAERVTEGAMEDDRPDKGLETFSFADVDAVQELEKALSDEDTEDKMARYDDLSPKAKELFLAAYEPDPLDNILQRNPRWVDKSRVPKQLILHWISRNVAKELGWRGFVPVPNTPATQTWVPGLKLHAAQRFIMVGRVVLCFKRRSVWLKEVLRDLKETNAPREELLKRFAPALRTRHSDLGLTKAQAIALEQELGGLIATRGPGPGDRPQPVLTP